jgi:hypothetical protein
MFQQCDGPGCSGLPCEIDPSKHEVNQCSQDNPPGAGGATFCVVGVPKGVLSTIVVFSKNGGSSGSGYSKPKQTSYNAKGNDEAVEELSYSSETPQRSSTISSTSTSSSAVPSSSAHHTSTYNSPTVASSTVISSTSISSTSISSTSISSTSISSTYVPSIYIPSTYNTSTPISSTHISPTHIPSIYIPSSYKPSTQYSHNSSSIHVAFYPSATISGSVASATQNGTITTHEAPKPSEINIVEQSSPATSIAVSSFALLITFGGAAMLF